MVLIITTRASPQASPAFDNAGTSAWVTKVHVHHLAPAVQISVGELGEIATVKGRVDQHVERSAEMLLYGGGQPGHIVCAGDVGMHLDGSTAERTDFLSDRGRVAIRASHQHHVRALASQAYGDISAQTWANPRNHGGLTRQQHTAWHGPFGHVVPPDVQRTGQIGRSVSTFYSPAHTCRRLLDVFPPSYRTNTRRLSAG